MYSAALRAVSLEDDDDVVETTQLDLQEEILDSTDGLEARKTPGATQNEQDSRVLDDGFEVENLRHPKQPPPPYAKVADLFNAFVVRESRGCLHGRRIASFPKNENGMDQD